MAASNRLPCFLATMKWEGGDRLSLDPRDPGNWTGGRRGVGALKGTKWGVAAATHPSLDIAALSADQALAIFLVNYWGPVGGDDLPAGLDHCVSDDAYNAGPSAALRRLRKAEVSGAYLSVAQRIRRHSQARLAFLESLKGWRVFGRGWARRVAGVEAESLKMALAAPRASAPLNAAKPAGGEKFVTPADIPPPGRQASTIETIIAAHDEADQACCDARRRVAVIAAGSIGATLCSGALAPASLIGVGVALAALLAGQLWTWRAHGARRDALSQLIEEIGARDADRES
ncbi:MAG TPA: glycosyl hydrolase 108 family protein [Roseiarcus sp.]|nr:glycosyl hydrolase 108 family protein [Roseiarcus sp.]